MSFIPDFKELVVARPRRFDLPHTIYHVLSRGNERQAIFQNDADHQKFLELLRFFPHRFGIDVLSYVLMGNHYHLILKNGEGKLSQGMQWLGTSYTSYFNWKWGRSGHLFQGRFKSFIVDEESYLRQLILYVMAIEPVPSIGPPVTGLECPSDDRVLVRISYDESSESPSLIISM
ncbi:MAG: transposase [Planctomycetota bacterium]|nr:transposase [Planctomycetota bacterium]